MQGKCFVSLNRLSLKLDNMSWETYSRVALGDFKKQCHRYDVKNEWESFNESWSENWMRILVFMRLI